MERQQANAPTYKIPIRQIVANTNPRHPLSEDLQKAGYEVFMGTDKDVWKMATSDDPEERAKYVNLIRDHDPEIVALATTILTQGQLQAVEVRDNGKKADKDNTYTLVFGCRRCLAILYHWCLLGKPKEPVVEAKLAKGNNANLLHRAYIENIRKQPNLIEDARSIQMAINTGETKEEVAEQRGISLATINNRLALLELPTEIQKKIAAGKTSATKALQGKAESEPQEPKQRVRSRKMIEEARTEFIDGSAEAATLDWVLGKTETIRAK